jgi:uncharacterized protein (DUF2062 family)
MLYAHHKKLITIAGVFLASWIIGTLLIHNFEAGFPIGENYFNALYFTVITTATIWFGDLVPMTIAGKILTMWYAIFYVPLFLYSMNIVFQANFQKIRTQDELLEKEIHDVEADVFTIMGWSTPIHTNKAPKK